MGRTFLFGVILVLFISCKQDKKEVGEELSFFEISTEKWPKKAAVSSNSAIILKDWPEFNAFDVSFDALYTAENTEDLSLVIEDLIEKQKLLSESEYPTEFDTPQVKSRQKVLQTFILKTKGHLEYRLDPQEPVLEMINAYATMRGQFNVITNNTLDIKTLLEGE